MALGHIVPLPNCLAEESEFPIRPIKVVVPFSAGGGSDNFGRILQSAIDQHTLLPQKLVMINVPGAGGTIGSRRVKNAEPDGYTILLLHEGILTAKYSGKVDYGPEAFEPIAATGKATQLIAVMESAPWKNLKDLVRGITDKPSSIVFGANLGAPSHFAGLMIEQQAPEDATFRFTQTGGGAKRIAGLQGGHIDVTSFSMSEFVQYQDVGLRALAVLEERRVADLPEVPTAREQGFDVVTNNSQFWWAPKGTPSARTQVIADALTRAMATDEVQEKLRVLKTEPTVLVGQALRDDLARRAASMGRVHSRPTTELPNIPLLLTMLCAITGLGYGFLNRPAKQESETVKARALPSALIVVGAAMLGYVLVLQLGQLGFAFVTAVFLLLTSTLIWRYSVTSEKQWPSRRWLTAICAGSLMLAFGLQWIFTHVLVVDLP